MGHGINDHPMSDAKHLDQALDTLRSELRCLDSSDDKARERLEELIRDVENARADPQGAGSQASLGERVKAALLYFEASHPRLAGVMDELVETLSNMGI
jgi:hypothetical protein